MTDFHVSKHPSADAGTGYFSICSSHGERGVVKNMEKFIALVVHTLDGGT